MTTTTPHPHPSGELPEAHRPRPDGSFDATVVTFAAMGLFDSLSPDQRRRVLLPHADPGRTHWNFLPESGRYGIPLGELDRRQEVLAHRLVAESMSLPAYARVVQVMNNEHVLRELNLPVFGHVAATFRDARGYFLTFFGQPQPDTTWGWRLVGHHLSINVTVVDGDLVSATPFLLGAEPARFGPFRILGEEEDTAFLVLDSLTEAQQRQAIIHSKPPADFVTRTVATVGEVEYPAYHGVGRRDAMITDEDRLALAYFRDHPRGLRAGDLSPSSARTSTTCSPSSSSAPARAWSASRWTASPPPVASRSCTSPGLVAPPSTSRTTSVSRGRSLSSNSTTPRTTPTTCTASGATPPTTSAPTCSSSTTSSTTTPAHLRTTPRDGIAAPGARSKSGD